MDENGNGKAATGPLVVAIGLLVAAVIFHGSILGVLLALAATVPAGYVLWLGSQKKSQATLLYGLLLLIGGLALAAFLLIMRVIAWL